MKKLLSAIILLGAVCFTSCDSFLDVQPVGKVIPNSLQEYRELFTVAYSKVGSLTDRGKTCLRTEEVKSLDDASVKKYYKELEVWVDVAQSSSTSPYGWGSYYQILYIANHIIDVYNKNLIKEGTPEGNAQLAGEAYMMRAYMHFILVNLYGQPYTKPGALDTKAVPLKLETDLEKEWYKNTVGEIYSSIQADVDKARQLINKETWGPAFAYRFSALSVEAFQSRLSLYKGDWEAALKASQKVLEKKNALMDMKTVSAPGDKVNKSVPNHFESVEMITPLEYIYSSRTNKDFCLPEALKNKYEEGDLRFSNYYKYNDEDGVYICIKTGGNEYSCTFRTGEIYLNAAEAAAQSGNQAKAKEYLFALMQNRYTAEKFNALKTEVEGMNKEALIAEILDERYRELAFEGHRWFDLRRTTRPRIEKTLIEEEQPHTYVLEQDDPRYTIHLPQEAINSNPNLKD